MEGDFIRLNGSVVFIIFTLFDRKYGTEILSKLLVFRSRSVKKSRRHGFRKPVRISFSGLLERGAGRTKLGVEGQGSLHAMTAQLPRVLDGPVRSLDLRDTSLSSLSLSEWVLVVGSLALGSYLGPGARYCPLTGSTIQSRTRLGHSIQP